MAGVTYHDLADKPEWVDQCTRWDLAEWPRPKGMDAPEHVHYAAAAKAGHNHIPRVIVAAENKTPIGMISLVDMDDPSFRPWVISIYIIPEKRGTGIFHALLHRALACAKNNLRVPHVYVYSHLPFEKWGWTRITDTPDPSGVHARLMVFRKDF